MSLRPFLAWLPALAMLLAPLAVPGAAAGHPPKTTSPAAHHDATALATHCDEQPQRQQDQDRQDKSYTSCCTPGCMAVAGLPSPELETGAPARISERPAPDRFRMGYLGEIATPPPRPA